MFLNPMERRTENKNSSLEKTVLVIWAQICEKIATLSIKCHKKIFVKLGTQGGKF